MNRFHYCQPEQQVGVHHGLRAWPAMEADAALADLADSVPPLALSGTGHRGRRWHRRAAPRAPPRPPALRRPPLRRTYWPQSHCPQRTTTTVPPLLLLLQWPLDSSGQCQSLPASLQGPCQQHRRLEWHRRCFERIEVVVTVTEGTAALRSMVGEPGYHSSDRTEPAAVVAVVGDGGSSLLTVVVVVAAVVAATAVLPCDEAVAAAGVDCDLGVDDLGHCYASSSYQVLHCRRRHTVPAAAAAAADGAVDGGADAASTAAFHPDHAVVHQDHTAALAHHHQDHYHNQDRNHPLPGHWSRCPPATSSAAAAAAADTVAAAAAPPSPV